MPLTKIYSWMLVIYLHNAVSCFAEECSEHYEFNGYASDEGSTSNLLIYSRKLDLTRIAIKYPKRKQFDQSIINELEFMKYLVQVTRGDGKDSDNCGSANRADNFNFIQLLGECTIHGVVSIKLEYIPNIFKKLIFPDTSLALNNIMEIYMPRFVVHAFHLIQAVETLQRKQIIHGDLSASNVGLNADGVLKVFDFGGSYRMHTPNKRMTCTPCYSAPEVLLFRDISDRSLSDTFSAGAIIYEMFTGDRYIGEWIAVYEACERKRSRGAWHMFSPCSARAYYYAHRLNRCSKEDSGCAGDYQEFEQKLNIECKPTDFCLSQIEMKYQQQVAFDEKIRFIQSDVVGRIQRADADRTDLIDILVNLLRFNYTERIKPKDAMSHNFFKQFNSQNVN